MGQHVVLDESKVVFFVGPCVRDVSIYNQMIMSESFCPVETIKDGDRWKVLSRNQATVFLRPSVRRRHIGTGGV